MNLHADAHATQLPSESLIDEEASNAFTDYATGNGPQAQGLENGDIL